MKLLYLSQPKKASLAFLRTIKGMNFLPLWRQALRTLKRMSFYKLIVKDGASLQTMVTLVSFTQQSRPYGYLEHYTCNAWSSDVNFDLVFRMIENATGFAM